MKGQYSQRGAVLIIALVFTVILTVIGVSAMRSATLQERMAGNNKDVNVAFQAAELAIRHAEEAMPGLKPGDFDGSAGHYLSCPDPADQSKACGVPDWAVSNSKGWVVVTEKMADVSRQPEYVIERITVKKPSAVLDSDNPLGGNAATDLGYFYRITARGFGLSDSSMVVLSTTYK